MKRLGYFIGMVLLLAGIAGCKKNKANDLRPNLNVADDQIISTRSFASVFRLIEKAVVDSSLKATHQAVIDNATVTLDANNLKYSFSFLDGMCADSVYRRGFFTATVDSGFFHNGTRVIVAFQGYAEDGHQVTGHDSIQCHGLVNGQYIYDNIITGALISKDSIRTIQFGASWKISVNLSVLVQGVNQTVFMISGNSNGISSKAYTFTAGIAKALVLYEKCPWISDGIISISVPGMDVPDGTIEFMAKTSCNDKVSYNFGGNSYNIWMVEKYLRN